MNQKHGSWLLIFFLICSVFTTITVTSPSIYIASADEIVYENEYGRMVVYPETSENLIRQEQYCNITWYKPDNTIDVAFRFNNSLTGGKIQYWNNDQWNTVTLSHTTHNGKHYYYYQGFNIQQDQTYHFRWYYNVQPGSSGKWDFLAKLSSDTISEALSSGRYVMLDPWWDSDWEKRKDIFIDKDQLKNSVKNFPIFVNISDADLVGDVQVDLDDIAFVSSDNSTQYNHEIEYYNIGATVEARIWVNVTNINGSDHADDTHLNMYYDNPSCSDQSNPTGVWDSDYLFVYHMNASTGGTKVNGCYDSTSNANHATFNGTLPNQIKGIVGYGQSFDGVDDWIYKTMGSYTHVDGTQEIWVNPNSTGDNEQLINDYYSGTWYISLSVREDNTPDRWDYRADYNGVAQWNAGNNSDASYTWQSTGQHWEDGDEACLWRDGNNVLIDSSVDTSSFTTSHCYIGAYYNGNNDYDGIIDEVRYSDIKRNDTWMESSYNTIVNDTSFITWSSEKTDTTTNSVTSITVETQNKNYIAVNWTRSTNANYTVVERNTSSSWGRGDGTTLYNGTDNSYNDTNCTASTVYYYQLWAFNESVHNFSSVETGDNHTGPLNPSNVVASISGSTINLTWTKGTRADNTVIMRKSDSYPSVIGDGTELFNGSVTGYDDNSWTNDMYYTLYSFNTTTSTASSGVNAAWGSLNVTCYDENSSTQIFNFTVFVTNQSGTETYDEYSDGNAVVNIDVDDLPTGTNVIIKVNASVYVNSSITNNYYDRVFYMDISPLNYYELKAYLPLKIDSYLYRLSVYGPPGQYGTNYPIEDANVDIKRYINSTSGWDSIGIYITDGDGNIYLYLIPGELYKITITADDYITSISDYIPSSSVFEQVFRLTPTTVTDDDLVYDIFWEDITITVVMVSSGFFSNGDPQLGNITITYTDSNSSTINTQLRLYEQYNDSVSLLNTWDNTSSSFNLVNSSINTTRLHYLTLHFNSSATYEITEPIIILLSAVDIYVGITPFDFDERITDIIGPFPIGDDTIPWGTVVAISLPMILLVSFGPFNTGLGILSCGMSMIFIEGILGIYSIGGFTLGIAGLGVFIVIVGVIYIMSKGQGGDKL